MSKPITTVFPSYSKEPKNPNSAENLTDAKFQLTRAFPFMAFLTLTTEFVFCESVGTMAATTVGGNKVFICEKFLNEELPDTKQRVFVIAHEILHIFLEHNGRQVDNNYHQKLWNVATDYVINAFLVHMEKDNQSGSTHGKMEMPPFGLYDEKYWQWSADAVYQDLLEQADNDPDKAAGQHGGNGDLNEMPSDGNGEPRPFDEVSAEEVTEAERAENRQRIAAAISQSESLDQQKKMGDGAAALLRQFQEIIESKISWKTLLAEYVESTAANQFTYNKVSYMSHNPFGIIYPALDGEHIQVGFGVDTSGSMSSADLNEAASELKGILDQFESWTLELMSCDTEAHLIGEYDSEEGDDFSTIDSNLVGGGGTLASPFVRLVDESDEKPAVLIIVTDGFIPVDDLDTAAIQSDVPVVVLVTSGGNTSLELDNVRVICMDDT